MKFKPQQDGRINIGNEFLNFDPVYYSENPEGIPLVAFNIPSGSVLTTILTRAIDIPEECGVVIRATIRALNNSGSTNDCFYSVIMDGTVLRSHAFNMAGSLSGEGSLQKVVREIEPGRHVFTMSALSEFGVRVIAEMTINLARSANLVVS